MKADHPNLTAYALGELSPAELAEIEAALATDTEIAAEIAETREMARILSTGLKAEPLGELAAHQRDAIFRAERISRDRQAGPRLNEVSGPVIIDSERWWNRPGPWQAVAAIAIAGLAALALKVEIGHPTDHVVAKTSSEFTVPVPPEPVASHDPEVNPPDLGSPDAGPNGSNQAKPLVGGAKAVAASPVKPTQPEVQINPQDAAGHSKPPTPSEEPLIAQGGTGSSHQKPRLIGGNATVVNQLGAGASVGVSDTTINAELAARLEEASKVKEGTAFADFAKVFRPVAGAPGKYEMIRSPLIKVDAEFAPGPEKAGNVPAPDSPLKRVSAPYLAH
jgi:hypothetical protein